MTAPGIPNDFTLSTTCFGTRLTRIEDQVFAAVAMGFRKLELGLCDAPPAMDGLEEAQRETGLEIRSMVVGCRDAASGSLASARLSSLVPEERERAMNSVRRHVRQAQAWGQPLVIVRGSKIEDLKLQKRSEELHQRLARESLNEELKAEIAAYVAKVQKCGHKQVEHLCRALHTLMQETPALRFAIEPGVDIDDVLGFESMGWVLDDLAKQGLGYWHDVGRIHVRERMGLPDQGRWLEFYGPRMHGIHLQDAIEGEAERPLGTGEVDFKLIREYLPKSAERVLEINARHGRAEVLGSVQFLIDRGF